MTVKPTDKPLRESFLEATETIQALIIADTATAFNNLTQVLEREHDILTTTVSDTVDALTYLNDQVDCVIVDHHATDSGGLSSLEAIRAAYPDLTIVFFHENETSAAAALQAGADHCIRRDEGQTTAQASHVAAVLRRELQRRHAERTAENKTVFVRGALDALDDVSFVFDLTGEIVHWNGNLTEISGYTDEEIANMTPLEFVAEKDTESVAAAIGRTISEGQAKEDADLVTKSGEYCPFGFAFKLLEDNGNAIGICGIARDVTDRNHREEVPNRHKQIVEAMGDGVYALDADERFEMVNDAFVSMTGYSREELLGEHISLLTEEADIENGRAVVRELLHSDKRTIATYEITVHTAADVQFPCEIALTLRFDEIGTFSGTMGVVRDVTDRNARNEELERYETIVETVPVGVFVLSEDGTILAGNDNAWTMVGYTADKLVDEPFLTLVEAGIVNEKEVEEYVELVRNLLSSETDRETGAIEATITSADGQTKTYLAHISLLPYEEEFRGTVGVFQDITERKQRERALQRQAEQLQTTNRINEIIRDVNQALVRASTREEIEQAVCANLAGEGAYRFAWIGKQNIAEERVDPQEWAGIEDGYLDSRPSSKVRNDDDVTAETALETGEIQVVQSIAENPASLSWREAALKRGYESAVAIPLVYQERPYGVLCVYSPRPNGFDETEREVLTEFGETIAYAFSSAERRRALISDTVIELEFALHDRDIFTIDLTARSDCQVTLDGIVERSDGSLVEFVTITGTNPETVLELAADRGDLEASLVSKNENESVFQLVSEESSSTVSLADMGGIIREGIAENGEGRLVFELPQDANVRAIVEAITDRYPDTELLAQRERERTSTRGAEFRAMLDNALTDRQNEVLKTAYLSGFFEWPRDKKGDEIAASLDISGATFHEHIRTGQRKLLESFYESASTGGS
ncbi:PAS domain S-box protein [Haladaptatus pallidirubidus]|uniref:PAS domain S-box-containing protein n=1 Tax=Haladaptatus pallidirubidus TaxID=1008152 RepID=A0AAV3UQP1_9EURY|nr:PAS domain S-box protein [Haladaptatus pallidirubidus]